MGGWVIIGSIFATLVLVGDPPPLWMLIGAGGLILTGQYDDRRALPPRRKLLLEVIVLGVAVALLPGLVLSPARLPLALVSGFFLLASINAYNLIDGMDGLAAGVGIASALGVSIIGVLSGNRELGVAGLAVAGALAGFMLFNYPPASIFMGDCGALPLGFLLGALALNAGAQARSATIWAAVVIMLMLAPLLDVATVSIGRTLRGSPLTRRGRDHAHYKLIALGMGEVQVAALCWTVAAVASLSAVMIFAAPRATATLLLPLLVLPIAILTRAVLELDETGVSSQFSECRESAIPDGLRLMLTIAIDALGVAASFVGAALLRLGGATTPAQAAALWSNLPIVLVAAMFTLTGVGAYRRVARDALKIEWARLGGASAAAGITLVLVDYWSPLIFSGWIALLFVVLLFGAMAAARATSVLPQTIFRADVGAVSPPQEIPADNSPAAAPNNGISHET